MDKKFWILIEKQWRQNVSTDLIATYCKNVEKDVLAIGNIKPVKNIWEIFDDEEDEDE